MKVLVLDTETRVEFVEERDPEDNKTKKFTDNSPHNPDNYLVVVGWRKLEVAIEDNDVAYTDLGYERSVYKHNDYVGSDSPTKLQEALDWCERVVCHNAKYDLEWLLEAGFRLPKDWYDTYIGEYILSRGTNRQLSLEATAIRRKVTHKKSELTEQYWEDGIGFEAMPLPIVEEYLQADVYSCSDIYIEQLKDWLKQENISLNNIVILMNEMLEFIVEIQRNGVSIDLERLDEIKLGYEIEQEQILKDLKKLAESVLGDTPFNLNSGADISKIVFSREVKDKNEWKRIFNIGTDINGKRLYITRMTGSQFSEIVLKQTRVIKRTKAEHCYTCNGRGYIRKTNKKGEPYKKDNKCKACGSRGFLYIPTEEIGGFKLQPLGPQQVSIHGFAVEKTMIALLIDQARRKGNTGAVEFLTKKLRLNAINTYLNSFVVGIKRWVRMDGLLHAGFNQCVTKTGRLSSSNINMQNFPKSKKFPVRNTMRSRFDGGHIMEADFSGLEFRIAGELSQDAQIIADVLEGKDIHRQTASIILQKPKEEVTKDERNSVKPESFKPLYGGVGDANTPKHIKRYYDEFFNIYSGHKKWQLKQMDDVLKHGKIRIPSGREFAFPGTLRRRGGETTNATKIKNYPIQSFATADIMPLACIRLLRKFRELNLKSLLILTIHDSAIADVYPGEEEQVYWAFHWAMTEIHEEILTRWGYKMTLPLGIEVSMGVSLGELETVEYEKPEMKLEETPVYDDIPF